MWKFLKEAWFPAALVLIFLAVIPGLVLVVLALLGQDADVNAWLEEHWKISYHLTLAPWLVLLLFLIPPMILLLYFLKLKRKPLQVPSTFLWKKSIEDLHVNALFQWLRQNILLLLQLLIVLVLIYSTLGLRFHGRTTSGQHYILVLDNSASMAATDVRPSRLEHARQEALREIDAAGDNDFGMVIVFNSKAATVQTYTNNRAKLREAVQGVRQTQRPTRLEEVLTLIDSLANPVRATEDQAVRPEDEKPGEERAFVPPQGIATTVHLFSDGRFAKVSETTLAGLSSRQLGNSRALGNVHLVYHPAGKLDRPGDSNNLGIVGMSALRQPASRGKEDLKKGMPEAERLHVIVRLENYRADRVDARVQLNVFQDGRLVHPDQRKVSLRPRIFRSAGEGSLEEDRDEPGPIDQVITPEGPRPANGAVVFELPPLDLSLNTVLHASLEPAEDWFPADNQAWLVVGKFRKAKVLIVGPANPILDAFFDQDATQRIARWQRLEAKELGTEKYGKLVRSGEVDLVIFDRCTPGAEADLPLANTLFINQVPPPWERGKRTVKSPYLILSKKDHPLVRYIASFWDTGVSEVFSFDPRRNLNETVRPLFELPEGKPERRQLPGMTRLVEAGGGVPVIFTLSRGPFTDLVLAFSLVNDAGDLTTNWPLQPSFPLFLRNVLYNLGNVDDSVRAVTTPPGEPMVLRPEAGVQNLKVTAPRGTSVELRRGTRPDFIFSDTEELGVYRVVRDDGGQSGFSVNLLDPTESNIDPRHEIRIGSDQFPARAEENRQPRELWKWVLLAALGLLVVEWLIYNQRVSV